MTKNILPDLLSSWEETYKKGQLTLWIFLALKDGQKYVDEIKEFIESKSKNTINCEEQSLYRNLRKYEHIDVVTFENKKYENINNKELAEIYFSNNFIDNIIPNWVKYINY